MYEHYFILTLSVPGSLKNCKSIEIVFIYKTLIYKSESIFTTPTYGAIIDTRVKRSCISFLREKIWLWSL